MNNIEIASSIADECGYTTSVSCYDECYNAAMAMADYKDNQIKSTIDEILTASSNSELLDLDIAKLAFQELKKELNLE